MPIHINTHKKAPIANHKRSMKSARDVRKNVVGGVIKGAHTSTSRSRKRTPYMIGGGPSSAIAHLHADVLMDGGAKGNDRQKQNTVVFKDFAVKTLNSIDASVTSFVDTKEVIKPKEKELRD